ncbi:MAG: amidohydrolase [Oscillospiraceae bacterium]|nr:amidohydrolase [Oscillospiraceae bacterium]
MIIKNGMIHDAIHESAYEADIAVRDGKIAEIGTNLQSAEGEEILDAAGLQVYPGLVEAHSHLGIKTLVMGDLGSDHNERTDIMTPHMRAIDAYYPQEDSVRKALKAGVTTVCVSPGSINVIGGTAVVTKTGGKPIDKAALIPNAAMKAAFGENPKVAYKGKSCNTRMGIAAKIREMLFVAKDYMLRKEASNGDITEMPKFDMKCEAMIPVLKGEIPLKAHAHRADDILTAIRIAKEFNLKLTLEHCTDGALIVDELVEAGCPVVIGPSLGVVSKHELVNKGFETPGILAKAGLCVSITTDHPVLPQESLPLCAGLAMRAGMEPLAALQAITINAARHIGVADRVGSLEVGKDADIVLTDGDILLNSTHVLAVVLDGERVV